MERLLCCRTRDFRSLLGQINEEGHGESIRGSRGQDAVEGNLVNACVLKNDVGRVWRVGYRIAGGRCVPVKNQRRTAGCGLGRCGVGAQIFRRNCAAGRAGRSGHASGPCCSGRPGRPGHAGGPGRACGPVSSSRTRCAGCSSRTGRTRGTGNTLRTRGPSGTSRASRPGRTRYAGRAGDPRRSGDTGHSRRAHWSRRSGRASRTGRPRRAGRGARRVRRAGGRTSRSAGTVFIRASAVFVSAIVIPESKHTEIHSC